MRWDVDIKCPGDVEADDEQSAIDAVMDKVTVTVCRADDDDEDDEEGLPGRRRRRGRRGRRGGYGVTYKFGEFELRPATWYDLPLAQLWVQADPEHAKTTEPAFWLAQSDRVNSFLLWHGPECVFFFRIDERPERRIEVHIQFSGPQALLHGLTRRGLIEGFHWLEDMLRSTGFAGYYFHSRNAPLIFFCQNRLGFEWDGTKLYRKLQGARSEVRDGEAQGEEAERAAQQ